MRKVFGGLTFALAMWVGMASVVVACPCSSGMTKEKPGQPSVESPAETPDRTLVWAATGTGVALLAGAAFVALRKPSTTA